MLNNDFLSNLRLEKAEAVVPDKGIVDFGLLGLADIGCVYHRARHWQILLVYSVYDEVVLYCLLVPSSLYAPAQVCLNYVRELAIIAYLLGLIFVSHGVFLTNKVHGYILSDPLLHRCFDDDLI